MNRKAKGNRIEAGAIKLLSKVGYKCCRSAASLGEWDVIGISGSHVVVVQCKANCWVRKSERLVLEAFKSPHNCVRIEWRKDDWQTPRIRTVKGDHEIELHTIPGIRELLESGKIQEN